MWFKNLRLFRLIQPFDLPLEQFETQLTEQAFSPCSGFEKSTIGWINPMGNAAPVIDEQDEEIAPMLTHVIGDYIMLCAQSQDRLLPPSVVKEATDEKVAEIEKRQARKVYRKEKSEIQENIYSSLLPKAFTRSTKIYAYISRSENLLVIDSSSASKAEDFLNLLRDTLGSFPAALLDSKRAPTDVMTRWLKEQTASDHFEIHNDCELINPKDARNIVRCKGQDLDGHEIEAHLETGKLAKQLSVLWNNQLSCMIDEELNIKRLRFEDIKEEMDGFGDETPAQKFDQEFSLMTLQLSAFFKSLFNAFGGLEDLKDTVVLSDNRDKAA